MDPHEISMYLYNNWGYTRLETDVKGTHRYKNSPYKLVLPDSPKGHVVAGLFLMDGISMDIVFVQKNVLKRIFHEDINLLDRGFFSIIHPRDMNIANGDVLWAPLPEVPENES